MSIFAGLRNWSVENWQLCGVQLHIFGDDCPAFSSPFGIHGSDFAQRPGEVEESQGLELELAELAKLTRK
jgi:hypothetical protein